MRETRIAQRCIFEDYSKHEFGALLRAISNRLDHYQEIGSQNNSGLGEESLLLVVTS
jgi:hypothetical protein